MVDRAYQLKDSRRFNALRSRDHFFCFHLSNSEVNSVLRGTVSERSIKHVLCEGTVRGDRGTGGNR